MYILASVRKLKIIFLSLLIGYAGVAWALDACLRHDGHADQASSKHHSDSQVLASRDDSRDPSVPVIHCILVSQQVGPAVRVASAEFPRSDKVIPLDIASLPGALSAVLSNDLWLKALFKRIVTFSLPNHLARHLFLSVLQI